MSSNAAATGAKMIEALPEPAQDQVVDHLTDYINDLQDELRWQNQFKETQSQFIAAAHQAKQETAQGLAKPLVYKRFLRSSLQT